ncbi:hypothetical protein PybrP1_003671 [[Pythium] brassicae (nom. inval.)]|nr:hypothetical protein PybrP1_003671 [[Pythium] brassicae (nom. inval.)]
MTYWLRFLRARQLRPNEVQAKVPMVAGPRAKRAFELIPVRDPEIYPLLLCVAVGFAMLALYNVRNLARNPDICLSKKRRETPAIERYDPEDGRRFAKHRARLATLRPNPVNTDRSFDLFDAFHYGGNAAQGGGGRDEKPRVEGESEGPCAGG